MPILDVSPTGLKQQNGLAERHVQTIKTLRRCLVAHLPLSSQNRFYEQSYIHAVSLYNRLPHSGIKGNIPYGEYFKRIRKDLTKEEQEVKEAYLSTQPAHLFHNIQRTLPNLPMFLEDGLIPHRTAKGVIIEECYFIGYTLENQILVQRKNGAIEHVTEFDRLGTFGIHQGLATRAANDTRQLYTVCTSFDSKVEYHINQLLKTESGEIMHLQSLADSTAYSLADSNDYIPPNFKEAMKHKEWIEAIEKEIGVFLKQKVFEELVTRIPEAVNLHTFWLFTRKLGSNEAKARLITINPKTVGHRDLESTSPVSQQLTQFIMFNLFVLSPNRFFATFDIKAAFLYAPVPSNEHYVLRRPMGFASHYKTKYVQLKRFAYGLNQSPLEFHKDLVNYLRKFYKSACTDKCLQHSDDYSTLITHHVDDILALSPHPEKFEKILNDKYEIKSFTDPKLFLGFDLQQSKELLVIGMGTYITKMVDSLPSEIQTYAKRPTTKQFTSEITQMELPMPTSLASKSWLLEAEKETPENPLPNGSDCYEMQPLELKQMVNKKFGTNFLKSESTPTDCDKLFDKTMYQKIVGILTYIANKGRFDMQYAANTLAQFNQSPTIEVFREALHLLRYAYYTRNTTYMYPKIKDMTLGDIPIQLTVYTDASFREDHCQGGYIILCNGYYLESKSYRISFKAPSIFEAELLALRRGVQQALRVIPALADTGHKNVNITAYCDNSAVVTRVIRDTNDNTPLSSLYRNCLSILRYYHSTEQVTVKHISGIINPADLFTKPMGYTKMTSLLNGPVLGRTIKFTTNAEFKKGNSG